MSARRLLALRPVRFLVSGGLVAVVALTLTIGLHVAGVAFQLAFLVSYVTAISLHFVLHRRFTFASEDAYALQTGRQARRFLAVVLGQYAFVAVGVALLAPALGLASLVVYLGLAATLSLANFLLMSTHVFHSAGASGHHEQRPAER